LIFSQLNFNLKITEDKTEEDEENTNGQNVNNEQSTKFDEKSSSESKQLLDNKSIEESIDLILSDGSLIKAPLDGSKEQITEENKKTGWLIGFFSFSLLILLIFYNIYNVQKVKARKKFLQSLISAPADELA